LNKNSNNNLGGGTKSPLTRNGSQKYVMGDAFKDGIGTDNDYQNEMKHGMSNIMVSLFVF
jgi:hypothetical protein